MLDWLRRMFRRAAQPAASGPRWNEGEPTPCECPCHQTPGMVHVMPCCMPCPKCGLLLMRGHSKHVAACPGKPATPPTGAPPVAP